MKISVKIKILREILKNIRKHFKLEGKTMPILNSVMIGKKDDRSLSIVVADVSVNYLEQIIYNDNFDFVGDNEISQCVIIDFDKIYSYLRKSKNEKIEIYKKDGGKVLIDESIEFEDMHRHQYPVCEMFKNTQSMIVNLEGGRKGHLTTKERLNSILEFMKGSWRDSEYNLVTLDFKDDQLSVETCDGAKFLSCDNLPAHTECGDGLETQNKFVFGFQELNKLLYLLNNSQNKIEIGFNKEFTKVYFSCYNEFGKCFLSINESEGWKDRDQAPSVFKFFDNFKRKRRTLCGSDLFYYLHTVFSKRECVGMFFDFELQEVHLFNEDRSKRASVKMHTSNYSVESQNIIMAFNRDFLMSCLKVTDHGHIFLTRQDTVTGIQSIDESVKVWLMPMKNDKIAEINES